MPGVVASKSAYYGGHCSSGRRAVLKVQSHHLKPNLCSYCKLIVSILKVTELLVKWFVK